MNITIIYATYSNSTALASEYLAKVFRDAGHTTSVVTALDSAIETFQDPDLLILASPSWDYNGQQGMPHEDFSTIQPRLESVSLKGKPTAVMALGDSSFTYFCGAATHLSQWLTGKGGVEAVSPLKIDQYYANEALAQQQITDWSKQLLAKLTN